jgi:hypothetical protein
MTQTDIDTLLARLDLTRSALQKVKSFSESGDSHQAFQALIEHYRAREKPVYLFDATDIAKFHDPLVIEEADRICDHEILGYRFEGEIDWHFNATTETSRDSEWTWSLVRHNFWVPLARAYEMTGDEKYAREFVSQLEGFVAAWPVEPFMEKPVANMGFPGDAWRSIEAGIRIYTSWLPAMVYFRKSRSWDEEGWLCFLASIYDHAEFLCTHYSNHTQCSSWLAMESTSLLQLGVMFPEFIKAPEWKGLGYRRICHEARYQFDHNGIHMERTPVYHLAAVIAFLQAYRICVLNGIPVPPYMLPILERSTEFLMRLVKPDLTLPMVGDSDRVSLTNRKADESQYEGMNLTIDPVDLNEIRAFFRTMAELTGREDFLYFATARTEGSPPSEKCYFMPDAGFNVFRTGWEKRDSYFLVTGTQVERGSNAAHSHSDAGHLEIHIEGEDVLIDTGRYLYGNCRWLDWWQYFQSTQAHNTVGVDGHRMGLVPDTSEQVRGLRTFCHRFEFSQDYDLLELSHNGFAFLGEPVFHKRRVIYLKPSLWLIDDILTGVGSHEYNLFFNFAPGRLTAERGDKLSFIYQGKNIRVKCRPLLRRGLKLMVLDGQTRPKGGWVSYAYSKKIPTQQLIHMKNGSVPVRFLTAVYVEGKAAVDLTSLVNEEQIVLNASVKGKYWSVSLDIGSFSIQISEIQISD